VITDDRRPHRLDIRHIASGASGIDDVLAGGILERSFNSVAGAPRTGQSTMAQQILFTKATRGRLGVDDWRLAGEAGAGDHEPGRGAVELRQLDSARATSEVMAEPARDEWVP
jgi:KaiC